MPVQCFGVHQIWSRFHARPALVLAHQAHGADVAAIDGGADFHVALREAAAVPDQQLHAGARGGGDHAVGFGEGIRHRLLAQDVLARGGGGFHLLAMQVFGRRHHHRFEVRAGEDGAVVGAVRGTPGFGGGGGGGFVDVGGRHQFDAIGQMRDRRQMRRARYAAAADQTQLDPLHLLPEPFRAFVLAWRGNALAAKEPECRSRSAIAR